MKSKQMQHYKLTVKDGDTNEKLISCKGNRLLMVNRNLEGYVEIQGLGAVSNKEDDILMLYSMIDGLAQFMDHNDISYEDCIDAHLELVTKTMSDNTLSMDDYLHYEEILKILDVIKLLGRTIR